jgi:hypothetical protein
MWMMDVDSIPVSFSLSHGSTILVLNSSYQMLGLNSQLTFFWFEFIQQMIGPESLNFDSISV